MIEYFKAREEGNPGKMHIVMNLSDEFVQNLMNDDTNLLEQKIVDLFYDELVDWLNAERLKKEL